MAKIIQTTQTGLTRFFAKFGRPDQNEHPTRENRWYDCDVCSRGL